MLIFPLKIADIDCKAEDFLKKNSAGSELFFVIKVR